jgi:hypothetical protein
MVKRKAPEELSTNVYTAKARKRVNEMSPSDLQIHKAKMADQSAVTSAYRKQVPFPPLSKKFPNTRYGLRSLPRKMWISQNPMPHTLDNHALCSLDFFA